MAQVMQVRLSKGESPNLGFRLQGGKDFGTPLVIQKVNGGSPADKAGLVAGDAVIKINNTDVFNLRHKDAQDVIIRSGPAFEITVQRGGSTWKPSVQIEGNIPSAHKPNLSKISPVTKTSLVAHNQSNIGAIGTGHNVAAKPFAPQVNGSVNGSGPKLVNKQYNSPVGLYSEQSIAESLAAQTEVLATGALGVNFKKNEKNFDITKSAVLSILQEAEKQPSHSHYESEPASGIASSPSQVFGGGLRHVTAPESRSTPPPQQPQLPPGQNICADCERLIVSHVLTKRKSIERVVSNSFGALYRSGVYPYQQQCYLSPSDDQYSRPSSSTSSRTCGGRSCQYRPSDLNNEAPLTVCTECERVIVGVFVRIKDKNLHVECFKCSTCGSSLKNVGYYNINNKLYCDVHAKLAAKNNAPAPNLVPVTLPPGSRVPAGTISAALSSHSYPSPAPLSPRGTSNTSAAPFQQSTEEANKINKANEEGCADQVALANEREVSEIKQLEETILAASKRPNAVESQNSGDLKQPINIANYLSHEGVQSSSNASNKAGSHFNSPRPFASVSSPLSPSMNINNYGAPLPTSFPPKTFASAPAPSLPSPSIIAPLSPARKNEADESENVIHTVDMLIPVNNRINVTIPLTQSNPTSNILIEDKMYQTTSDIAVSRRSAVPKSAESRVSYLETDFSTPDDNNIMSSDAISISISPRLYSPYKSSSTTSPCVSPTFSFQSSSPKYHYHSDSDRPQKESLSRPLSPVIHISDKLEPSEKPRRFVNSNTNSEEKICNVCNNEIERGPFITALGKIWCPDHFICATPSCRRPLQDIGFVEEQGKLYCEFCFEQYLAPNCAKCNGKIKADCLRAIQKHFHPECFKCAYCSKMFGNTPFFLEDGLPYCQDDWNELFTTKCFACGFPVEAGDRWVEALNNNYHTQCFNCTMCKKNLEGQSFFAKGGRPYCKTHAR